MRWKSTTHEGLTSKITAFDNQREEEKIRMYRTVLRVAIRLWLMGTFGSVAGPNYENAAVEKPPDAAEPVEPARDGEHGEEGVGAIDVKPWWSQMDKDLHSAFNGLLDPDMEAQRTVLPLPPPGEAWKVSIICPTYFGRSKLHQQLYTCFLEQTYKPKELVVVDTGSEPSPFFTSPPASTDERVIYRFYKEGSLAPKVSIGMKRNLAVRLASGSVIAHFDDDDLYAPAYLEQLVYVMRRNGAHALTLWTWFVFDKEFGGIGYVDNDMEQNLTIFRKRKQQFGYGFSYLYRRDLALQHPFGDKDMHEDYNFFERLWTEGYSVCMWPDIDGICLRVQHGDNCSKCWATNRVPRHIVMHLLLGRSSLLGDILRESPEKDLSTSEIVPARLDSHPSPLLKVAQEVAQLTRGLSGKGAMRNATDESAAVQLLAGQKYFGKEDLDQELFRAQRDTPLHLRCASDSPVSMPEKRWRMHWLDSARSVKRLLKQKFDADFDWQFMLRDKEVELRDDALLLGRLELTYTLRVLDKQAFAS